MFVAWPGLYITAPSQSCSSMRRLWSASEAAEQIRYGWMPASIYHFPSITSWMSTDVWPLTERKPRSTGLYVHTTGLPHLALMWHGNNKNNRISPHCPHPYHPLFMWNILLHSFTLNPLVYWFWPWSWIHPYLQMMLSVLKMAVKNSSHMSLIASGCDAHLWRKKILVVHHAWAL